MKGIDIRKREVKSSLFADDVILHVESPKDSTHTNISKLIHNFSKVAGYKNQLHSYTLTTTNTKNEKSHLLQNQKG